MRFPKDTRAAIRAAAPAPVTIDWPRGQRQPEEGKVYRLQRSKEEVAEELRIALESREARPETHREVMAQMYRNADGEYPEGYEPPAIKPAPDPDLRIKVLEVTILEEGWQARVVLWEEPDPTRHLGVKTRVPAGLDPASGEYVKVETEPERISVEAEEGLTREAHELRVRPAREVIEGIESALDELLADPAIGAQSEIAFLQKRLARLRSQVERYPEVA